MIKSAFEECEIAYPALRNNSCVSSKFSFSEIASARTVFFLGVYSLLEMIFEKRRRSKLAFL